MKTSLRFLLAFLFAFAFFSCQFQPLLTTGSESDPALASNLQTAFRTTIVTRDLSKNGVQSYSSFQSREVVESTGLSDRVVVRSTSGEARTAASKTISVFVNQTLYGQIAASIQTYVQDLQSSGYATIVHTVANNANPVDLKNLLRLDFTNDAIQGAVLIGNLPVAWYEMRDVWDNWFNQFPCDYYYMDLDGDWSDSDANGVFDKHSGASKADIWVARIRAGEIADSSSSEANLVANYFVKNHRYRTGALRLTDKSLAVINADWNNQGFENQLALAYPNTSVVKDPIESVTASAFVQKIAESSHNQFESLLVAAHSNSQAHAFYSGGFYSNEIEQNKVQVNFYNLFACSGARFTDVQNLAEWYAFQSQYGLNVVGTTKTGSMLMFDYFYRPLNEGFTLGDAFLSWFQNVVTTSIDSQSWFYGMTMIGDPTLKISRHMPVSVSNPPANTPTATVSPTSSPSPLPSPSPSPSPLPSPSPSPVPSPTPTSASIQVYSYNMDSAASTNRLHPKLKFVVAGSSNVSLAQVKLRYYYTADSSQDQAWSNEYANAIVSGAYQQITSLVNGSVVAMSAVRPTADRYVEIGFSSNVVLTPGSIVEVQFGVNNGSWSNYTQTNDYSFVPAASTYVATTKVLAFVGGSLVSGSQP